MLCIILTAGLWPFHAPHNDVAWLPDRNGLAFGARGTVLSSGPIHFTYRSAFSLEIWLQPALADDSNTFLALATSQNPLQFSLHQSIADLCLQSEIRDARDRRRSERVYVDNIFERKKPVFLTVTLTPRGTDVYRNGTLARGFPQFQLSGMAGVGQLVIGTSPTHDDSWPGHLLGLAMYRTALPPARILEHYRNWTTNGSPGVTEADQATAVYLFNEGSGAVVHNQMGPDANLYIPGRYVIFNHTFLERPWREFFRGWSYCKDLLINIGGFVPLGFFFCAYWSSWWGLKRAAIATVLLGAAVTLTIEILQAYLPSRQSGMTDLITNTLGTCLGVGLYSLQPVQTVVAAMLDRVACLTRSGLRRPICNPNPTASV